MPFDFTEGGTSGGSSDSFKTIQVDNGTNPVATSPTDTLTFTSSDGSVVITGNSATDTVDFTVVAAGGGDVDGPASSTDNAIARFDGTTGKLIQNSVATLSDAGLLSTADVTVTNLTSGSVVFAGTGGALSQDNSNFFYDNTNDGLIIGDSSLSVNINSVAFTSKLVTKVQDLFIQMARFEYYNDFFSAPFYFLRARNSKASPNILTSGDIIATIAALGYTGNSTVGYQQAATINLGTDTGTISTTSMPGRITFNVSPDGSTTPAEALRISQDKTLTAAAYGAGLAQFSSAGVVSSLAPGTSGNIALSNGSAWTSSSLSSAGIATNTPSYVTLATSADLANERVLTAGTAISITDAGAGSTVTIANTGVTSLTATANQTTVSAATGAITIGTVQSIGTGSSPQFTGLTLSGLTQNSILFAGSGGLIDQSATSFIYDKSADRMALGQTATTVRVNSNVLNVKMTVDSSGGTDTVVANFHKHATTTESLIYLMRSRGTNASPNIVQNGDVLGSVVAAGYTGNSTVGYQEAGGLYVEVSASGTVSTTSMPSTLKLKVTADSSVTPATALEIASNKTLTLSAYGAGLAQFSSAGVISSLAPGSSGNIAQSNGTAWVSNSLSTAGIATNTPQYLTLAASADLTNERVFTPGTSLTATDGGAGGNYSLNTIQDIRTSASPQFTGLTLSGLTSTGVLYNVSGVITTESVFTYDQTNNILFVPEIAGGSTTSSNLMVSAYSNTFADTNTGRIQFMERMVFDQSFTPTGSGGVFSDVVLSFAGTITSALGINISPSIQDTRTLRYSTSQTVSAFWTFSAATTYTPTTAVTDTASFTQFAGFVSRPKYAPDISSGTAQTDALIGFASGPLTRLLNAGTSKVTSVTCFGTYVTPLILANDFEAVTITNLYHFRANNPVSTTTTLTNNIGIYIPALNLGTNRYGYYSDLTASANYWDIYSAGGAQSSHEGLFKFGDNVAPTALVHTTGSTTARASMRIEAGTAPTSPNSGDIWHDSTRQCLMVSCASLTQGITKIGFAQTANANINTSAVETTLIGTGIGTKTLPANFLTVGKTIKVRMWGFYGTKASPVGAFTIRFKYGSTTLVTLSPTLTVSLTNQAFNLEFELTCRTTGATGTVFAQGEGDFFTSATAAGIVTGVTTATTTINTTASNAIDVTAQWATSNASNTITSTNYTMEILY